MDRELDHDSIDDAFRQAECGVDASECHGALCGLLCGLPAFNVDLWLQHTLVGCDPAGDATRRASTQLLKLAEATQNDLNDPDYGFSPLLPGDDEPLQVRTQAVSHWCNGFLQGLRVARVKAAEQLPGDVGEILRDLAEIAKAKRFQVSDTNENEADFTELVEYLRAAVRVVYEDMHAPPRAADDAPRAKPH